MSKYYKTHYGNISLSLDGFDEKTREKIYQCHDEHDKYYATISFHENEVITDKMVDDKMSNEFGWY